MIFFIGGSFDPIHLGHLHVAQTILEHYQPSKLYLVPTSGNPLKEDAPIAPAQWRWQMVLAALGEQHESRIEALDWEIHKPTPSFTVDTVNKMIETWNQDITFVIGNDIFPQLPSWKSPRQLLMMANCVVITRHQELPIDTASVLKAVGLSDLHKKDNRNRTYHSGAKQWVETFQLSPLSYSATALRKQIHKGWASNDTQRRPEGIQRSVWQLIKENRLYAV